MNIEWINKDDSNGAVTLYRNNICLNKKATSFLADAYAVAVGIEKTKGNIIIKAVSKEEVDNQLINKNNLFKLEIKTSYGRISSKKVIDSIINVFKLDFSTQLTYKFGAIWNTGYKTLVINIGGKKNG